MKKSLILLICICFQSSFAEQLNVELKTTENKTPIGTIKFEDSSYGLIITPSLTAMGPGLHGLHLHQNPSCDDNGNAAGGHLDPQKTNQHLGPFQNGHLGDLPVLYVDQSGSATGTLLAPKLKVKDLIGKSVMVHDGGDNYSDKPLPLGGGHSRIACGVIKPKLENL